MYIFDLSPTGNEIARGAPFRAIRRRTQWRLETTVSFCLIPRLRHETLVSNVGVRRWDLAREFFLPRFIRKETLDSPDGFLA